MSNQAAAQPAPPAQSLVGALISTALLAGFIAWQFGWIWAIAGVTGVFVHEYGHVLAINALGYGPGRIQIIPFFGGAATPKRPPASEFHGVLIALAGPVFGLLAMAPFFVAYAITGQQRWLGGALFVSAINLLNLAPAPPLDGSKALGPALARIHPWLERAAMLAIGGLALAWAIMHRELILGVFVGLGALGALRPGRLRPWASPLSVGQWLASIGAYLLAILLCALAVAVASEGSILHWIGGGA
jgi:Zn-dependent protease